MTPFLHPYFKKEMKLRKDEQMNNKMALNPGSGLVVCVAGEKIPRKVKEGVVSTEEEN